MFKRIMSAVLAALLAFSLCSCREKTLTGKSFAFSLDKDPVCLDPQIADNESAFTVLNNCMEGLVRLSGDGQIIPGAAKSWYISEDGLTYTFYLRTDAKWHITPAIRDLLPDDFDASVTADDFIFAFQRAVSPVTKAPHVKQLYAIENAEQISRGAMDAEALGVSKDGDFMLVITLRENDPDFLYGLCSAVALPCNRVFFELTGGRYGLASDMLMCNGGFYLKRWIADDYLSMPSNGDYSGESETAPSSLVIYIEDKQAQVDRFNGGETDAVDIPAGMLKSIDEGKPVNVSAYRPSTYSLLLNQKCTLLKNPDVRAALVKSVDVYDIRFPDYLEHVKGIIPEIEKVEGEAYSDVRQTSYSTPFDSDSAREHLGRLDQSAISAMGELTLLCPEDSELRSFASHIIQYWQKYLGVYISMEALPDDELTRRITEGSYEAAFYPVSFGKESTVINMRSSVPKLISLSDGGYESIFASYDGDETEISDILKMLAASESYLTDNHYILPMCYTQRYFITAEGCQGIDCNTGNGIVNFMYALK